MTADGDASRPDGGMPDGGEPGGRRPIGRRPIGRDPAGGDRQDADGADRSGEPDATEADLLRQWEEKIAAIGDPFGALADVLAQGAGQRSTLFQQVGERVLGCDLRTILGAGGMGVTYGGVASDGAFDVVGDVAMGGRENWISSTRAPRRRRRSRASPS